MAKCRKKRNFTLWRVLIGSQRMGSNSSQSVPVSVGFVPILAAFFPVLSHFSRFRPVLSCDGLPRLRQSGGLSEVLGFFRRANLILLQQIDDLG